MLGFRSQMPWSSSAPAEPLCDHAAAVVAARRGMETPLTAVAEAFEELARGMAADGGELRLAPFGDTCALVSVLFSSLGMAFKFAEIEYVAKVNDLIGAGKSYRTLNDILDKDVENDSVKKQGSHSRNLRRVRLGLGLIKALFEQFLATEGSLYDAATTAYGQVCAPFHSWAIRKAVGAGMYTLPTREQLILRLNETDSSVQKEMRRPSQPGAPRRAPDFPRELARSVSHCLVVSSLMSLLTSPTPFGTATVRRRAVPAGAVPPLLPLAGRRAALHVALARRGGVSSRTQRRLEERGGKKGRGGVSAPAPPDVDEETGEAAAEWEDEPLGFEVSTEPMPELPDPETPDFWEGPQWEPLGFFVQYMWAFGVVFGLIACGVAVATYNDGATDFRNTPAYKESLQSQEFPEESESSGADVFEGNPTEVAPALE